VKDENNNNFGENTFFCVLWLIGMAIICYLTCLFDDIEQKKKDAALPPPVVPKKPRRKKSLTNKKSEV
jgi:hypothetical protein